MLYYKIYRSTNVYKFTKEDYIKFNGSYYDEVKNTKLEDFQIGGSKRMDLCVNIPLVRGIAEYSNDENFKRELNEYLTLIQYDEKEVYDELFSSCLDGFRKKKIL